MIFAIKQDPLRRKDRRCALRGCTNTLQPASVYAGSHGLTDPFCSRGCAATFHGVEYVLPKK